MSASCRRAGCIGHIDDGYCDTCGHRETGTQPGPAETPAGAPTPTSSAVVPDARAGAPCGHSGCAGMVAADGYCDQCGRAASKGSGLSEARTTPPLELAAGAPSALSAASVGTSTVRRVSAASIGTAASGATPGSQRAGLGAGLVDLPSIPERDPLDAVIQNPEVTEKKRYCGRCGHPVGRVRGPRPARPEGYCPHCGAQYSFTPKLAPGDLVAGQYLVAGCLAHGGLGWVYLAQDMNLDGSWVVLKGLLDSGDNSAMAAALAEKRFLTEVRHANIVRIYNFVQHGGAGYIVMEYIGGESLKELRLRHRAETGGPLPVAQAIAYVLGILPALAHLHHRGLLFCDFKPDNVIRTGEHITLIDLGGVRREDDQHSDLYGTVGYQAPEVGERGASVASDLYTVGRTLAVLSIDFPGYQDEKRHATSLPPVADVAVFERYDSFYRFLLRATAVDPSARFQSAEEMAEQLLGVLRQVVAVDGGSPSPAASVLFSAELGAAPDGNHWQFLPLPAVDPTDPAAGILATLALASPSQQETLLATTPPSPELSLAVARLAMERGDLEVAAAELESAESQGGGWRVAWWRGVLLVAEGQASEAVRYFAAVSAELPGELAPKLALAACHEHESTHAPDEALRTAGLRAAARTYSLVASTDPTCVTACFGLARVCMTLCDRDGAVAALQRVPRSSASFVDAQVTLCSVLCADIPGEAPTLAHLVAASKALHSVTLDSSVRLPLARDVHSRALALLVDGKAPPQQELIICDAPLTEDGQRLAIEQDLRDLAKRASKPEERWRLVDLANELRPRTLT